MPFLQMLQSVESPQLFAFKEPNFQTLLRLQHMKKPWELNNNPFIPEMETQVQGLELESCVTHETVLDLHSPVKSETKELKKSPPSSSCVEVLSSGSNQHQQKSDNCSREPNLGSSPQKIFTKSPPITRERRKRKRTKAAKNKEEVESQRMTHIAVERNRRRQMNDYLNSLRSLMPPCYIQRGDQASIIAGAIDFVKELEQFLQSLEAQKRTRKVEESNNSMSKPTMEIHQQEYENGSEDGHCGEEVKAESKTGAAEVEVNVIHNHVNLKIQCSRRAGQLIQAIVTLETLRLTVLHLNITTSQASVLYSFNLKLLECGVNRGPASQHALPCPGPGGGLGKYGLIEQVSNPTESCHTGKRKGDRGKCRRAQQLKHSDAQSLDRYSKNVNLKKTLATNFVLVAMQRGTWEEPQDLDKRSRQLAQAACTPLMEAMLTRSPKRDVRIVTAPMRTLTVEGPRTNNTIGKLPMTSTRRRLGAMTRLKFDRRL
ncbi:hypothetical protein GOBAR_AA25470 [Gossypium barbadense]|uniref:BHLH domain-containing protein n=1 Tax=Gossypium barbadense TaxID=3634 RepID=A0A2P5WVU3_GOSBA|nr:hypothetical protein GOBAR_AA25470 [Gossypium barbadense]